MKKEGFFFLAFLVIVVFTIFNVISTEEDNCIHVHDHGANFVLDFECNVTTVEGLDTGNLTIANNGILRILEGGLYIKTPGHGIGGNLSNLINEGLLTQNTFITQIAMETAMLHMEIILITLLPAGSDMFELRML